MNGTLKKKLPIETWMVTQGQTKRLTASEVLSLNDGLNITWSRDLPPLNLSPGTLCVPEMNRTGKK